LLLAPFPEVSKQQSAKGFHSVLSFHLIIKVSEAQTWARAKDKGLTDVATMPCPLKKKEKLLYV